MSLPHDDDVVLGPDGRPLLLSGAGDRRSIAYGVLTAELVVVTALVVLRFISRRIQQLPYWWDDWLILPAWIYYVVVASLTYWQTVRLYFGVHIGLVTLQKLADFNRATFVGQFASLTTHATAKLSILAFYWRAFGKGGNTLRWTILIFASLVVAWVVMNLLLIVLQCRPLSGVWDKTVPAECNISFNLSNLVPLLTNTVIDGCLLAFPVAVCLRIYRPLMKRLALKFVFGFGFLNTVLSILRILAILRINFRESFVNIDSGWYFAPYILLTISETACLITTACLPTLMPVLMWVKSRVPCSSERGNDPTAEPKTGGNGRARKNHHSSPWSLRLWGVESSRLEQADNAMLNPDPPQSGVVAAA